MKKSAAILHSSNHIPLDAISILGEPLIEQERAMSIIDSGSLEDSGVITGSLKAPGGPRR